MKRLFSCSLTLLVVGAASAGSVTRVSGALTHPGASTSTAGVALFQPLGSAKVTGAVAVLAGTGATGAAGTTGASSARVTTIAILVDGLRASSPVAARIFTGRCGSDLVMRYRMPPLRANAVGDAAGVAAATGVTIPLSGIHVNVYGMPGMQAATGMSGSASTSRPIACANVHQPGQVVQIRPMGGSKTSAFAFVTPNQPVLGTKVRTGTEVIVYATGLQPGVAQAEHIHAGPCGATSPVQYPLLDLVADRLGRAIAGTGVMDAVPMSGVSLHIHATNWMMEACGDFGTATTGAGTGGAAGTPTTAATMPATTRTTTAMTTPMTTPMTTRTTTAGMTPAAGTTTAGTATTGGAAATTPTARPTTKP